MPRRWAALAIVISAAPFVATADTGEAPAEVSASRAAPERGRNQVIQTPASAAAGEVDDHVLRRGKAVMEVDGEPTLVERVVTALRIPPRRRTIKRFRVPGRVGLDRGFVVTGRVPTVRAVHRVKRWNRRVVKVQQRTGGRWRTIARKRAWAGGGFRIRVRSPQSPMLAKVRAVAPNVRRVRGLPRLQARRQARLLPRAVSPKRSVGFGTFKQVRAMRAPNTEVDWAFLFPANRQRWQRCTITWAHDSEGQPYAGATRHVRQAFGRIQARTGFTFEEARFDAADVRIVWRTANQNRRLAGGVVGIADARATPDEIIDARIVLDRETTGLAQGFDGRNGRTWGNVFTHEITHGMGLGHAFGHRQVMHSYATDVNGVWGAGDLAGLGVISSGCRS